MDGEEEMYDDETGEYVEGKNVMVLIWCDEGEMTEQVGKK